MNNRYREEEKEEKEEETSPGEQPENEDGKLSKKDKKLPKEIKELREETERLQRELKAAQDKYLLTLAETENFRKRNEEERSRERKYASQRLLEKLIVTVDIFDKACHTETDNEILKNFLIGFQMIYRQIWNILTEEGIKKIKTDGLFDPRFHHAVEKEYDEKKPEGIVSAVIKNGYLYKDRVLEPALVKVNMKPEQKETTAEDKINDKEE